MTDNLIAVLRSRHAFDSAPPFPKLARTHVRFDDLTGTTAYETALSGAVLRGERVALVGATGSGKSSITAHVFNSTLDPGLAPLQIRVDLEDPTVATQPASFARHVVRSIAKVVERIGPGEGAEARSLEQAAVAGHPVARSTSASLHAGVSWLSVDLAKELGGAVRLPPTASDQVEIAQLALAIIARQNLLPLLILDDTDHWLAQPGSADDIADGRIRGFFGPVMRLISEDLGTAAAVVAVHESYVSHPGYVDARGFLETTVRLPRLQSADAVGEILRSRATDATGAGVSVHAIIDDPALTRLFRHYAENDSVDLRGLLRTAHTALGHADDAGGRTINVRDVEQGIDYR